MNDQKKRILVIDDEESLTRLLKACLEDTGRFIVQPENVPTRALETASQFHPDLILLDIMMPELDGDFLVNQFKADLRFRDIPIVFLTALATPAEVHQHRGTIGGLPILAKPVNIPEIIDCLSKQLAV
jgi:CheY-like chemotaxis protein